MIREMRTIEQVKIAWEGKQIVRVNDFTVGEYLQITLDDGQSYEVITTTDCVLKINEFIHDREGVVGGEKTSKASKMINDGWVSYGTWPEGWCDDDVEFPDNKQGPPMEDIRISILDFQYERLGGYKALHFNLHPRHGPKGLWQWIVFLWGTDIWFGRWPFCKCVVAVNVLVWVLGGIIR